MTNALAFEPERAAVALNHVTHGQRRGFAPDLHGVHFPAHHGFRAHDLIGPDQVQMGALPGSAQPQIHVAHLEFIHQPTREIHQGLQQGKAVDPEPQGCIQIHGTAG
ncbi:hypothetical protein LP414_10960 [Polaromonas sp. P1(28)-13]|nr:hypothetical protein LP414_10960 [Polaromonas sp. P1(28)-13]